MCNMSSTRWGLHYASCNAGPIPESRRCRRRGSVGYFIFTFTGIADIIGLRRARGSAFSSVFRIAPRHT